jgi:small subunit ribosomal protein S8
MSIDSIGNFLTIIRNGFVLGKRVVEAPYSRVKMGIAEILKDEGFINDFEVVNPDQISNKKIKIILKYVGGESVIHEIKRLSRPGRRSYAKISSLKPIKGKLGVSILSTNQGLMTDKKAKDVSVGGEVICSVW